MTERDWHARAIRWIAENPPPPGSPVGNRVPDEADRAQLRDWSQRLHAAGFPQMRWPSEWGGSGASIEDYRSAERVFVSAGSPLPMTDVAVNIVAPALMEFGTLEQKRAYLPGIADGSEVWTQLFSEPNAGSDLASLTTRADRVSDGWRIRGQKVWNTYASVAKYGFLLARTGSTEDRHRGLTAFTLPMGKAGVGVRPIREMTGTWDFAEVFLDDVILDEGSVLGDVHGGWQVAMSILATERAVVGGFVERLRSDVVRLHEVLEGSSWDGDAHARSQLGAIAADVMALSSLLDSEGTIAQLGAQVKVTFADLNLRFHQLALDVIASGSTPAGWTRRWQDGYLYAFAYTISGGANEVLRNVLAHRAANLPRL